MYVAMLLTDWYALSHLVSYITASLLCLFTQERRLENPNLWTCRPGLQCLHRPVRGGNVDSGCVWLGLYNYLFVEPACSCHNA